MSEVNTGIDRSDMLSSAAAYEKVAADRQGEARIAYVGFRLADIVRKTDFINTTEAEELVSELGLSGTTELDECIKELGQYLVDRSESATLSMKNCLLTAVFARQLASSENDPTTDTVSS